MWKRVKGTVVGAVIGLAVILLLGTVTGVLRLDVDRGKRGHCGHDTWDVSPGVALSAFDGHATWEYRLHDTCVYPADDGAE